LGRVEGEGPEAGGRGGGQVRGQEAGGKGGGRDGGAGVGGRGPHPLLETAEP